MNEVLNAIITRRSCKSFKPDMIPQQDKIVYLPIYLSSFVRDDTEMPILQPIK